MRESPGKRTTRDSIMENIQNQAKCRLRRELQQAHLLSQVGNRSGQRPQGLWGRPSQEQSYGTSLSDDGKYLLLTVSHGWNRTDLFVRR